MGLKSTAAGDARKSATPMKIKRRNLQIGTFAHGTILITRRRSTIFGLRVHRAGTTSTAASDGDKTRGRAVKAKWTVSQKGGCGRKVDPAKRNQNYCYPMSIINFISMNQVGPSGPAGPA
jgi:hypothetical protein